MPVAGAPLRNAAYPSAKIAPIAVRWQASSVPGKVARSGCGDAAMCDRSVMARGDTGETKASISIWICLLSFSCAGGVRPPGT